jgi:hypothetical protein
MSYDFFPSRPKATPIVYAYSDTRYPGLLKVGYTTKYNGTQIYHTFDPTFKLKTTPVKSTPKQEK